MNKTISKLRAFTLIELLVVVAIIAILTTVVLASLSNAKLKARDGKRISDIGQIQLALEQFFSRCQQYPTTISGTLTDIKNGCPSGISLASYISKIPKDPSSLADYKYSNRDDNLDYVLRADLESPTNSALNDALTNFPSGTYTGEFTCITADKEYCVGPK